MEEFLYIDGKYMEICCDGGKFKGLEVLDIDIGCCEGMM